MAIKIPFIADVAAFLKGTKDMETALEHVEDALDDLGRNTSTDALEQDLTAVGTEADKAAEKLETSFSSAFDKLKAEGRTATQRVRADVDDVGSKGSATLQEFSQEAKQNVAESVSSFRGDAESAVDAVQSTFGGLVSALGPAGVVGAAVVGVGIGLARGLFEKAQERAQEVAEAVAEIAGQLIDLGGTSLGSEQVNEKLKEFAETAEDGSVKLNELAEQADDAGISFRNYARGLAGDSDAIQASYDEITAKLAEIAQGEKDLMHTRGVTQQQVDSYVASHLGQIEALEKARKALVEQDGTLDQAATTAERYAEATKGSAQASQEAADALEDENEELAENARLKGEAVSATWDMREALDGVSKAGKENGRTLDTNTDKGRDNARAIKAAVDAVNAFGDAQIEAGRSADRTNAKLDQQEDALVRRVAKAFGITEAAAQRYIDRLGGIPRRKETEIKVTDNGTVKRTQQQIDSIKSSGVPVPVDPDMSGFDASMRRYLNGRVYYATVYARPGQNAQS